MVMQNENVAGNVVPANAESNLDSRLRAAKEITQLFNFERYVYMSCSIIAVILLFVSAIRILMKGDSVDYVGLGSLFGSGGLITYSIGRLIYMWNKILELILATIYKEETMENSEVSLYLAKSSKRAALLSLLGVLIAVAAFIFSFYYLNKKMEEVQKLDTDITAKQDKIDGLDKQIKDKETALAQTEKVCADFQSEVKEKDPEIFKSSLAKTIEKNPQAQQVIQNIKPVITPTPATIPKKEPSDKLKTAQGKEREGFQALISGNYDGAIAAFQEAENTYNSYHQVYELAHFLKANKAQMNDPAKKKELFQMIVKKFPYGAPPDLWAQVKAMANQ